MGGLAATDLAGRPANLCLSGRSLRTGRLSGLSAGLRLLLGRFRLLPCSGLLCRLLLPRRGLCRSPLLLRGGLLRLLLPRRGLCRCPLLLCSGLLRLLLPRRGLCRCPLLLRGGLLRLLLPCRG